MAARADDGRRNLVPRWRYTSQVVLSSEHAGDPARAVAYRPGSPALALAKLDWCATPTVATASELISCACAFGQARAARAAAEWLNRRRVRLPPALAAAVDWILRDSPAIAPPRIELEPGVELSEAEARRVVARSRHLLEEGPRNVARWLDLSLAHSVLGNVEGARRAMCVAVGLAPDHRVVLRVDARLMIHQGQADEAHVLIRRHPRTATDPWLMATEISLARILDRPAAFALRGRRFALDHERQPAYITELAGAVATMEEANGEHRRARKLYQLSLVDPTDNVLAQAQYAAQSDRLLRVDRKSLELPAAVEARMWSARADERWDDALQESRAWQRDEPFSSRPALASSYLAACVLDQPALGAECARAGLRSNPDHQLLRNNLVVALSRAGRHAEAAEQFRRIKEPLQRAYPAFVYEATRGLVAFIAGDPDRGRQLYQEALQHAPAESRPSVSVNWLVTEWDFVPAARRAILEELAPRADRIGDPEIRALAKRLVTRPLNERSQRLTLATAPQGAPHHATHAAGATRVRRTQKRKLTSAPTRRSLPG